MEQPAIGTRKTAADGKEYEFWINEFQQRWWRQIDDPSVLVPYFGQAAAEERARENPTVAGYEPHPLFG